MQNLVTVIEFASSGIRLVSGYSFHGKVYVTSSLEGEPLPLDNKGFIDKKEAEQSLAILINTAKNQGTKETGAFIALLPPVDFKSVEEEGHSTTIDTSSRITQTDFINCINIINKEVKEEGKQIIYDDPYLFLDDSKMTYTQFPIGKASDQLTVRADAQMISKDSFDHYMSILKDLQCPPYIVLCSTMGAVSFMKASNCPDDFISLDLEKDFSYLSFVREKRLKDSFALSYSLNSLVSKASQVLSLKEDRIRELITTYGLDSNPGFEFKTSEGLTLERISGALKEGLSDIRDSLSEYIRKLELNDTVPLVIYGPGGDILHLDKYLSYELKRPVLYFTSKVIGARSKTFLNCLGAIRISSLPYSGEVALARKKIENEQMRNSHIGRN